MEYSWIVLRSIVMYTYYSNTTINGGQTVFSGMAHYWSGRQVQDLA